MRSPGTGLGGRLVGSGTLVLRRSGSLPCRLLQAGQFRTANSGQPIAARRVGSRRCFRELTDKPESSARDCPDQTLLFAAVAERMTRGMNVASQCRQGHGPAAPDGVEEFIFTDHPLVIAYQIDQQVENLRSNCNQLGPAPQLTPFDIEHKPCKRDRHVSSQPSGQRG
jgi:hypothetical protein